MAAGFAARLHVNRREVNLPAARERAISSHRVAYAPSSASSDTGTRSDVDLRPLETFYEALRHLRDEYVEPIQKSQERELAYGAVKVMLDSLHDPLTRFLDPEQVKLVEEAAAGRFYGIGATIAVKQEKQGGIAEERLVVASVLPGSPAEKAGLLTGDVITEVDGKAILPYDPFQRVEKLVKDTRNGLIDREKQLPKLLEAEGTRIKNGIGFQKASDMLASKGNAEFSLMVARSGTKTPLKIKVTAGETGVDAVSYGVPSPSVGYVRLNLITKSAQEKFAEAVASFKKRGVKGIVVDLRDSPGGSLEAAQAIAADVIPGRTLSILQLPRGKQQTLRAGAAPAGGAWQGPVAVVVDGGTVGIAEVLAAAIRDGAGAKLVGERTFGDNMQQSLVPLRDGSAFTMTTGKYLTPKGGDYRAKGLAVDVVVPGAGKPGEDPQLAKAFELLASGKGRG